MIGPGSITAALNRFAMSQRDAVADDLAEGLTLEEDG
jgi:hypothetical protein